MAPTALHTTRGRTVGVGLATASVLTLGTALQGAPVAGAVPAAALASARPNIVVVMADDMRASDIRYTPTIARLLGNRGLRFLNSFSPDPLCAPARASFLTGQYSHTHGVTSVAATNAYGAFDDSDTIAVPLQRSGYNTGFIGKYVNGYGSATSLVSGRPSLRYVPRGWTDWYATVDPPAGSGVHGDTYHYFDTPFNVNGRIDNSYQGVYSSEVMSRFARRLVGRYHQSPKPFFLYVNFVAPHVGSPHESDDVDSVLADNGWTTDTATPARPQWVKGQFDWITHAPGMPADGGPAELDMSDKPSFMSVWPEVNAAEREAMTSNARQRAEAVYVLDVKVGAIIAKLKATHEWWNTIFVFTSDNGYFMGEHRARSGKIKAHEPSLRVPFLVTGPGMRLGQRRYDPITMVDAAKTILVAGHAWQFRQHGYDGVSKLSTMLSGDRGWTLPVVTEGRVGGPSGGAAPGFHDDLTSQGIRTARYSYIKYKNGEVELYDLAVDPNQMENVAGRPEYSSVQSMLEVAWWRYSDCAAAACRVPLPVPLQATPSQTRALTISFWNAVRALYGP